MTTKTAQNAQPDAQQDTLALVLQAVDSGESDPDRHLSIQIDDALREAIQAAHRAGESATVTIKVKVEPGPDRRVHFSAGVKAQLPRPPTPRAMLYADPKSGRLYQSDPNQGRLPFTQQQ